ncbi:MAG TPA: L-rhamnose isomerase [Psychromonas hadalis]|nr:L-rhamnose isomerase [Psychromonas hadalis]
MNEEQIVNSYKYAQETFKKYGVDTEKAIQTLSETPISVHCWQGDDVRAFEAGDVELSGGIHPTGNYVGAATTPVELRADMEEAFALIPGKKRVNLHAIYLDSHAPVERDQIKPENFSRWVEWAKENDLGLDFNPTLFSHPMASDGLTLSHPDPKIRNFWIDHLKASRKISEYFGKELGSASFMNIWIPDGLKDQPTDRLAPRQRLAASFDLALAEKIDTKFHKDAVESKVFGIGVESYTVGSHELYLSYAISRGIALSLDAGHFHPTECFSDKITACSIYIQDLLLHVTRPVRWDSDHVVAFDHQTQAIMREIVRNELNDRVAISLDFFDASINRIAAWVIGTRNIQKALLKALLEPIELLKEAEENLDYTTRLGLGEEAHSLPWGAVWDYYCLQSNVPVGFDWMEKVRAHEAKVLTAR